MVLTQATDLSANAIQTFEPYRMNNWTLDVSGLASIGLSAQPDPITLALQSFQLPVESTEPIEIFYMNEKRSYAGRTVYDGGTLSLVDWIDKGTAEVINAWRRLVYDPASGKIGFKRTYAARGTITQYTPSGNSTGLAADQSTSFGRQWILEGLWPEAVSWGALDMSSSDKVQIDVTMRYDKAIASGIIGAVGGTTG